MPRTGSNRSKMTNGITISGCKIVTSWKVSSHLHCCQLDRIAHHNWRLSWLVGMKCPPSSGIRRQPLFGGTYLGAHVIRKAGNHRKYRRLVGELDASLRTNLSGLYRAHPLQAIPVASLTLLQRKDWDLHSASSQLTSSRGRNSGCFFP